MGPSRAAYRTGLSGAGLSFLLLFIACGGDPGTGPAPGSGAPRAQIIAPEEGRRITIGTPFTLRGAGEDADGSPLPAASLFWESSLEGALGSGPEIVSADLRLGTHLIRLVATGSSGSADTASVSTRVWECGPFGNWDSSAYVLPYPAGTTFRVIQSNCSGFGHSGFWKHGYDFDMPIGTRVVAARGGEVGWATDGCPDGNPDCTNLITIIHADGTVALYSHLTPGGVFVRAGERVAVGQVIGGSGNTGNTGGVPHLHFSLHPCNELPGLPGAGHCPSIPINFRNTQANPDGLVNGTFYTAEAFR